MRPNPSLLCLAALTGAAIAASATVPASAEPRGGSQGNDRAADVAGHWTAERVAEAQPRDLVIDQRGLGYLQAADGSLTPHGHGTAPEADSRVNGPSAVRTRASSDEPTSQAKPSASKDTTPPAVSDTSPAVDASVGTTHTFSATVTDDSGVKSVSMSVSDGASSWSFSMSNTSGNTWSVTLTNFTVGDWSWYVVATDRARPGNTTTTTPTPFTVSTETGGTGGTAGDTVTNAEWTGGGKVQTAAGRIYFEMPANGSLRKWNGYVCSGTVVTDTHSGQSVILTAAHCVYDDVNKAFARNVLFIPNQAGSGTGTDTNCDNDLLGCWAPSYGVVDLDWTTRTFPDNIPWDYAYYVVPTAGAHFGTTASESLESAAGTLEASFAAPAANAPDSRADFTHALGYSYSDDPNFMYCAEDMTTEGADNWWLPSCDLSGGSSGGPWIQPMSTGEGPVISVNSWGYSGSPGMAGPKLSGTTAGAIFDAVNAGELRVVDRGVILDL